MKKNISIYQHTDFYLKAIQDPWYLFLAELYNIIYESTTDFYKKNQIKTLLFPTTTSSVSSPMGLGSDSTPVEIIMNNNKTYLADSMQFLLEYGCRFHKNGCYSLMPSYRGEKPDKRHLSQFFHSEVEIVGNMSSAIKIAEDYIRHVAKEVYLTLKDNLLEFCDDLTHIESLINNTIPQISFDEAISQLNENEDEFIYNSQYNYRYLTPKGEKKLIDKYNGFIWISNFDHLSIPFYQAFEENNTKVAKAADLLMGMGETIGLGERHTTGSDVIKALDIHGISHEEYKWYIELKEKFPLKTSGYGLGVERFICWLLQHDDIQDCQLFLRFNNKPNLI